ncbi:hypothetical protein [Nocardioides pocheonensis]|uniref:Uncharacterized protein n=1 Tax=Nocardioides pocheonensis TaxID=661485 RepID=A0A3N0GMN1_9ACTN|nr:hypothetical protein [Nocardioides pocheonensis]RNM13659.1 hypothetical protein EFL26_11730 [Nocardioides pocheonensis]
MKTNNTILGPSARLVATVRDELRERREERSARRSLERELASYRTPAEINDLLGVLSSQDSADADEMREVLLRQQLKHGLHRYAS